MGQRPGGYKRAELSPDHSNRLLVAGFRLLRRPDTRSDPLLSQTIRPHSSGLTDTTTSRRTSARLNPCLVVVTSSPAVRREVTRSLDA